MEEQIKTAAGLTPKGEMVGVRAVYNPDGTLKEVTASTGEDIKMLGLGPTSVALDDTDANQFREKINSGLRL